MAATTNYSWTYPTVNANADTWGSILNTAIIAIDASLHTVDVGGCKVANNLSDVTAATARTNLGLGTGATRNITVSSSDPSGSGNAGDLWVKI